MNKIWNDPISLFIDSKALGEERPFSVFLPHGYDQANTPYPILFHLDGDVIQLDSILTATDHDFPAFIYVSIPNTNRTRDMCPIETSFCENPGAAQFMHFFETELIPFIDSSYRTSEFKILCGQSFSAVFALYTLVEKPSLFNSYITSSLYFPQCKEFFIEKAGEAFSSQDFEDRYLFITLGGLDQKYNKDGITEKAVKEFTAIIDQNPASGLKWTLKIYPDYGHCPEPSYTDGLNWISKHANP